MKWISIWCTSVIICFIFVRATIRIYMSRIVSKPSLAPVFDCLQLLQAIKKVELLQVLASDKKLKQGEPRIRLTSIPNVVKQQWGLMVTEPRCSCIQFNQFLYGRWQRPACMGTFYPVNYLRGNIWQLPPFQSFHKTIPDCTPVTWLLCFGTPAGWKTIQQKNPSLKEKCAC